MNDKEFTHLTKNGIHMVDVSAKSEQNRLAISSGNIYLKKETIEKIQKSEIKKGNVLTVAQIAGIQAVKNTSDIMGTGITAVSLIMKDSTGYSLKNAADTEYCTTCLT